MTYTTRGQYLEAMATCRQFAYFGVLPVWNPEEPDIDGYIHDEVVRQGHDPNTYYDGELRINKMRMAWDYARKAAAIRKSPYTMDIIQMGRFIEDINTEGFRQHPIVVGGNNGAPFKELSDLMHMYTLAIQRVDHKRINEVTIPDVNEIYHLWNQWVYLPAEERNDRVDDYFEKIRTVDDAYIVFELIHPFGDGNGRLGKILAAWISNRLENPWLPPNYFGGEVA